MPALLGLDSGTSGARAVAADVDDIAGLGLTGQMHGSVFLDAADEPLRPALLWNDQRTARQAEWIADRVGERRLIEIAGNPALTGFQAPKVRWLADEEPERFARDWSDELLEAIEVPREWLPEVREGTAEAGRVRDEVAADLGLPRGLVVAAGGGDNAAAAVGLGVIRAGLVSSSIGTSGVVFAHGERFTPDPSGRIHACCHAFPGAYHVMAVTLAAGDSLAWWRDRVARGEDFESLVAEAAEAPPGARGLVFLPYLSGERTPHRDPRARGAFVGLTGAHGRGDMTRAIMEGVALSLRDGLEAMLEVGVAVEEIRAVGGGARSALWRQIQADAYGRPVHRTLADEGPAYGAALLGGVAAGVWEDVHAATAVVALRDEVTEPGPAAVRCYEERYGVFRELYPALRDAMHALA